MKDLEKTSPSTLQARTVFDDFEAIEKIAKYLANAKTAVPQFLRNNEGDCFAVSMQAYQWGLSPLFVAQDSYQVQQGAMIAYGSKVYNATITRNAPIIGRPKYEMFGDWSKVQGKIIQKQGNNGKKYSAPGWKLEDEEGLGVDVIVHIKGETEPRRERVLLASCWPRNSTLWANNPAQQIKYSAIRMIARLHFTDVLAGAVFLDEMDDIRPEKDVTPNNSVDDLLPSKTSTPVETHFIETVAPLLADIENAATLEELKRVGKKIKTKGENVQDRLRPVYLDRADQLRGEQNQDAGQDGTKADEPAETIDEETGEVKGDDHGPVDPATLMKMAETANSKESIEDIWDMASNMDKRSKAYKDLAAFLEIRHAEIAENAASE